MKWTKHKHTYTQTILKHQNVATWWKRPTFTSLEITIECTVVSYKKPHIYSYLENIYLYNVYKCTHFAHFRLVLSWSLFIQVSLIQICDHWLVLCNCATVHNGTYTLYICFYNIVMTPGWVYVYIKLRGRRETNENIIDHSCGLFISAISTVSCSFVRFEMMTKKTNNLLYQIDIGQRAFWP